MAIFEQGSVSIEVDEDGFMQEPEKWNEEVAAALGSTEGVDELTDDHWKVVNYLRDYYLQFGVAPMIRKLCSGPVLGAIASIVIPPITTLLSNHRERRRNSHIGRAW